MIKEHLLNINKIMKMAIIDLKKIYKGAALGWLWIVAKPTVNILIYWLYTGYCGCVGEVTKEEY